MPEDRVPPATIRADFDRIARLPVPAWNHNNHYHGFVLRQLPQHCVKALDVGCGAGEFARLLARRSDQVIALDLAPEMIRVARTESTAYANIDYAVADVLAYPLPEAAFDGIVSIATLHHLPLTEALAKLARALRPGGTLVVLDLFRMAGPIDWAQAAIAAPVNWTLKLRTGQVRQSEQERAAWKEHARHDVLLSVAEVRRACAQVLPGARVRRHVLWRYSIVWTKPDG